MSQKTLRVLVLAGGPSAEHTISRQSGLMVVAGLSTKKYHATLGLIDQKRRWRFGESKTSYDETAALEYSARRFDVVFLALHGAYGEDGTIQALLSSVGLRYTGSDIGASALAWDKALANRIAESIDLAVPRWTMITDVAQVRGWRDWPAFLKPAKNGSSIDVALVTSRADAEQQVRRLTKKYPSLMLQRYCRGRELTCGVIEDQHGVPQALPVTEIRPKGRAFFDYQAKYTAGLTDEITPASLPRSVTRQVQTAAVRAHHAFGCRGLSRSDFILVGTTPWYLETNTIPGLTKLSLLPQEAQAAGMSFSDLLDTIIRAAM